jgi:uroporphyrin-III C-methyltransferase
MIGRVSLVGAGPGDPELLTIKAARAIERATVLLVDDLVSEGVLAFANASARVVFVGKRGGCASTPQAFIDKLMLAEALKGEEVVRLKGGDPFIFGRGSEEVEALEAAGVPYEIVPGVSTFTAVPALTGIPLTARGIAAQVTILTGTSGDGSELDYDHLAATPGTLVIFMGLKRLEQLADNLILAGRRFDEPVAVVSRLSLPDAQVRTGTLGTIAAVARGLKTPSLVVVGDVVAKAAGLRAVVALAAAAG